MEEDVTLQGSSVPFVPPDPWVLRPQKVYPDCPICLEWFDEIDHIPHMFPCGHTFCRMCITEFYVLQGRYPSGEPVPVKSCPECQSSAAWYGFEKLPKNYAILRLIRALKEDSGTSISPSGSNLATNLTATHIPPFHEVFVSRFYGLLRIFIDLLVLLKSLCFGILLFPIKVMTIILLTGAILLGCCAMLVFTGGVFGFMMLIITCVLISKSFISLGQLLFS